MIQLFERYPYKYLSEVMLLLILGFNFFCPVLVGIKIPRLLPGYSKYLASKSFNKAIKIYQEASKMNSLEARDAKYLEAAAYFSYAGDLYFSLIKSEQINKGFSEKIMKTHQYISCTKIALDRVSKKKGFITVGLWF